jgi:hypothetical protein
MILRDCLLFWMILLDDDDDWNHLTKTPYTTARKGRKKKLFLTHFCVLLMLLESELHFIVLHLDLAFVPLSITLPDLYCNANPVNNNNNALNYYLKKTFIKLVN